MSVIKITSSKFGVNLGEFELDTSRLSEAQIAWAIENGLSQAGTDSHASHTEEKHESKEKAIAAAKAAFKAWFEKILSGHVPTRGAGGARLSPLERALRECVTAWLEPSMKKTVIAKALAEHGAEKFVMLLAYEKAEKTGGDAQAMFTNRWAVLNEQANKLLAIKANTAQDLDF